MGRTVDEVSSPGEIGTIGSANPAAEFGPKPVVSCLRRSAWHAADSPTQHLSASPVTHHLSPPRLVRRTTNVRRLSSKETTL